MEIETAQVKEDENMQSSPTSAPDLNGSAKSHENICTECPKLGELKTLTPSPWTTPWTPSMDHPMDPFYGPPFGPLPWTTPWTPFYEPPQIIFNSFFIFDSFFVLDNSLL